MIEIVNTTKRRNWQVVTRDAHEARWTLPYVTLNSAGDIFLSRWTHEAMGSPEAYVIMFDFETQTIGLRPARMGEKHGYPARPRGSHGGRRLRAYRLLREFGVVVYETVRFHRCMRDREGILILDLRDVKVVPNPKKKPEPRYAYT